MYIAKVKFKNGEEEIIYQGNDSDRCIEKARMAVDYYADFGGTVEITNP